MPGYLPFAERNTPWRGVLDLVSGRYPSFLFGGELGRWLPVFHFHEARQSVLEPLLKHLAENGYRTVTSDVVARYARDGVHPGRRSVALCFDDAWASLWTVAAPLLRKFGLQAIAYVHPGRVTDASGLRPTMDSAGGADAAVDRSTNPFATWPELRALHASGTLDIQAHTFWHAQIPCAPVVTDFVSPRRPADPPHTLPRVLADNGERFLTPTDLGAPLYPCRARCSDALRYDDPAGLEACLRHVREHGREAFFQRPDWATDLRRVLDGAARGRWESPRERDAAILKELAEAREDLNLKLGTDTVRHMCFPWAIAGRAARTAADATGYVSAFSDRLFGARGVRPGDPPYQLMRLKHSYIRCLPGKGRAMAFAGMGASRR